MVILVWAGFLALVLVLMVIDLGIGRKSTIIGMRQALRRTAFMVLLALAFAGVVYFLYENHVYGMGLDVMQISRERRDVGGLEAAKLYLSGWLVEYSLSLDNLFVFLLIFRYFAVPPEHQLRALVWGIIGAIVLRAALILPGAFIAEKFEWATYVFGAILLWSAYKMLRSGEEPADLDKSLIVRFTRRVLRVSRDYDGDRFITRGPDGARLATPLLLVLVVIDLADVVFAVDSIPAIFGITLDPFIVFTSNIFAILGLRALFFALSGLLEQFRYLKMSMIVILFFVAAKMLSHEWTHEYITPNVSLAVIVLLLAAGIVPSMLYNRRVVKELVEPLEEEALILADVAYRNAKKLVILVVGSTVILAGLAMVVLPGPGWLVVFGGLAILATEFVWARRLLKRVKAEAQALAQRGKQLLGLSSPEKIAHTPDTENVTSDEKLGGR